MNFHVSNECHDVQVHEMIPLDGSFRRSHYASLLQDTKRGLARGTNWNTGKWHLPQRVSDDVPRYR